MFNNIELRDMKNGYWYFTVSQNGKQRVKPDKDNLGNWIGLMRLTFRGARIFLHFRPCLTFLASFNVPSSTLTTTPALCGKHHIAEYR